MKRTGSVSKAIWVIVAGMCILWMLFGMVMLPGAKGHDFLNLYTGASLAREGRFAELHNSAVQLEREQVYYPKRTFLVPFVRPVFYAVFLSPLASLSFDHAFVVWVALQSALLLACWAWGFHRFGLNALVFGSLYLPAPLGIGTGQDCVVMLALLAVAYELAERKRFFASGATLALMLIKFHLIVLWPVALLLQRRWRMLCGYCAAAAVEVAITLALGGVRGARQYLALLQDKSLERLSPSPELMVNYQGLLENLGISSFWIAALMLGILITVFVLTVREAPLWRMFSLTALASLFVAPHVYAYDATLLLVPVFLVTAYSARPLNRIAATLFSTPLPFGFALAGKPYALVASASLLVLLLLVASESTAQRAPDEAWQPRLVSKQ